MQITSSSLPGPLWAELVAPDMSQIELFDI